MRFFVAGFFFVIVDGMTVVLGIVIAEVPAEVVVVLAVIVAGQLSYQQHWDGKTY
jgi:hypothetical protein